MGSMKYSLAFVALPAGSSRQRARCIKTGRFVSWAVAPLLRVQVATPSPSPCTVPLLDRVVVVVVVVVVAFLVALVTVSPLPLAGQPHRSRPHPPLGPVRVKKCGGRGGGGGYPTET